MVSIRKFKDSDRNNVLKLNVADNQVQFVGPVSRLFDDRRTSMHPHVIVVEDDIVGFFNIDTVYSESYDFTTADELGLRTFFIDEQQQGKGYGRLACNALKTYLAQSYSRYSSIVLTVNCKNPYAYKAYLNGGFIDTGKYYLGGRAGPQHVMRMAL